MFKVMKKVIQFLSYLLTVCIGWLVASAFFHLTYILLDSGTISPLFQSVSTLFSFGAGLITAYGSSKHTEIFYRKFLKSESYVDRSNS